MPKTLIKKPLVSTITPCFRMAKYLPLFLEHLPKQTFFPYLEVVLDHNEPTEEEITLVKEFQKKYPNVIKHIIRKKVDPIGISMNRCINEASADLLTIWNVDDLRTDNSIELQVNYLLKNTDKDFVYGDYKIVKKFGTKDGIDVSHAKYTENELTRSMIIGPFFMFRKSIIQKSGYFDEQLKSGADFDLAIRLALHGQSGFIKENLGFYLNEGLGASTRPNSLQPVERTVIELRYGIYDKIEYKYLPLINKYSIGALYIDSKWIPIANYIENYPEFLNQRAKKWLKKGLMRNVIKNHKLPEAYFK